LTELEAAGFHPGLDAPTTERDPRVAALSELPVEGEVADVRLDSLADVVVIVLRDSGGSIVATWDDGRWWTAEESDALTDALEDELRHKLDDRPLRT
jgi:hypothetical protein